MIAGSCTPPYYYGFMCDQMQGWRWLWLAQVWICSLAALACVLIPAIAKIQWVKALAWVIAGYSTLPGFIHLYKGNSEYMRDDFKVRPWLVGGGIYAIGAIIFGAKMPERCIKKKFDIWGASH